VKSGPAEVTVFDKFRLLVLLGAQVLAPSASERGTQYSVTALAGSYEDPA
jgi:hypothetical protein